MGTSTDHVQRVMGRKRNKGTPLHSFHHHFPYNLHKNVPPKLILGYWGQGRGSSEERGEKETQIWSGAVPPVNPVTNPVSMEQQKEKEWNRKQARTGRESTREKLLKAFLPCLRLPLSFCTRFFCPCSQTAYNACIFQIWSMKNFEELGGGFEPIRNGEVFWMDNNILTVIIFC